MEDKKILKQEYAQWTNEMKSKFNAQWPTSVQLHFYALFKLVKDGPAQSKDQPWAIDFTESAQKWHALNKLGNLSPEIAMQRYNRDAQEWLKFVRKGKASDPEVLKKLSFI